jgi:hypothetical protein
VNASNGSRCSQAPGQREKKRASSQLGYQLPDREDDDDHRDVNQTLMMAAAGYLGADGRTK